VGRGDECMEVVGGCSATIGASKRPFCRTGNGHDSWWLEEMEEFG